MDQAPPSLSINMRNQNIELEQAHDPLLDDANLEVNKFESLFLVMEYFHQDVGKVMHSIKNGTVLEDDHIKTILYNALCAVHFMHSANMVHRNLSPKSMLIDANCQIKICDFDMVRTMGEKQGPLLTLKSRLSEQKEAKSNVNRHLVDEVTRMKVA